MSAVDDQNPKVSSKLMRYGMMVCCAVMLLPIAAFLFAGGSIAGLWNNIGLFAPIILCVGAHVLMFKVMGNSCHGSKDEEPLDNAADANFSEEHVTAQNFGR